MNELSLFTGAGGMLGGKILGWRTISYVEIDRRCQEIIKRRITDGVIDDAPIFADIRSFDGRQFRGLVDVVTAGFPCTPFSIAGKRKGEHDENNYWPETIRALREVEPRFALLENVPGLVTDPYFGTILGDLYEAGFDAEWDIIGTDQLGGTNRRRRLWIFAYAGGPGLERYESEGSRIRLAKRKTFTEFGNRIVSCGIRQPELASYLRVGSTMAGRMDRLKPIGNGQCPQVAAYAFESLMERAVS